MKKAITILILIISFFIIYFLQANFFSFFTIAGVKPNLFVILILFISLFAGYKVGITFGLLSGLYLDIIIGKSLGTSAIMLCIIGAIGGYFDRNFSKESKITIILMVLGSTLIYEAGTYFIKIIRDTINVELLPFITKLIIESVYNCILTIILYPIFQKAGYRIEDIFKENKILTRYF